jgi:hypothetical protein
MLTDTDKIQFLKKIKKEYTRRDEIVKGRHRYYGGLCSAAKQCVVTETEHHAYVWFKSLVEFHLNWDPDMYYDSHYLFKPHVVAPRVKWLNRRIRALSPNLVTRIMRYFKRLI